MAQVANLRLAGRQPRPGQSMTWVLAGSTWGARAWDWAMYQEPIHSNAYDAILQVTGVGPNTVLLDVACGSGLALQRASALGARCTGVDASRELLEVARDRAPNAELIRCDMAQMPLPSEGYDVVTSINGVQFGARGAVAECARVLRVGGLLALAFWQEPGDYEAYFDAIAVCSPSTLAGAPSPTALREPGTAEHLLAEAGLTVVGRGSTECRGIYRDVNDAYRGLAASGPAVGAIAHSGEDDFHAALSSVVDQHQDPSTGRVLMTGVFGYVIARRQ